MGLNVDLTMMLGAPYLLTCPRCGHQVKTDFDDYDIECGNPNPSRGEWRLRCYCCRCEYEFEFKATAKLEVKA